MTAERPAGWRWRNVPVPVAHVGGLLAGGTLELVRRWPLGLGEPLASAMALVLGLVGVGLVTWSVLVAGRQDLEAPSRLVTTGPYRYSRNPMYVGWTALYLGIALAAAVTWPLVLFPGVAAMVHRQVRREERALEASFGEAYRRYRSDVRRYL